MPSLKSDSRMALVGQTSRQMPQRTQRRLKYSSFTAPGGLRMAVGDEGGISETSFKALKAAAPSARSLKNCLRVILNLHQQPQV